MRPTFETSANFEALEMFYINASNYDNVIRIMPSHELPGDAGGISHGEMS